MKNFIESKAYRLTCLSPVHIGSGETLKAFEYIYDRDRQQVYFIDEAKWAKLLYQKKLMAEFAMMLQNPGQLTRLNVFEWLCKKGINKDEIASIASRVAQATTNSVVGNKGTLNDLQLGCSMATGELYIPGSAIKGMLRTGILYHALQKNAGLRSWAIREMRNTEKTRRDLGRLADRLEAKVFSIKENRNNKDVELKLMSGLQVGDALPIKSGKSLILQKVDVSTYGGRTNQYVKKLPLFRECIQAGSEFQLRISVDKELLARVGLESVEQMISYARQYTHNGLKLQKKAFGKAYDSLFQEADSADCMLGAGTGFYSKSVWFSLFDDDREAMAELRHFMDGSFRKHRHGTLDKIISPRTLKLAVNNQEKQLMGMCSLQEVQ